MSTKTPVINRESVKKDQIRDFFRKNGYEEFLLSDDDLLKSRRKFVPDESLFDKDIWLYGYGSLIWNPMVETCETRKVKVYGFHRKFCLKTDIGRGSKQNPGLMLALQNGGSSRGIALKVRGCDAATELDLLWRREMITGAYVPTKVTGHTEKGKIDMIAFVINKNHFSYENSLTEKETAKMIAIAKGFVGTSKEYLDNTIKSLKTLGMEDRYLNRLQNYILENNF